MYFALQNSLAKRTFQLGRIVADVIYKRNKSETLGFELDLDGTI
jgi:hypothetical protein